MTDHDIAAAFEQVFGRRPELRRPRHPEAGCPCEDCSVRDDRLETIAEDRAAERRGHY